MHPTRILRMQPTRPMYRPMPKEEHSGIALIAGLLDEAWDEDSFIRYLDSSSLIDIFMTAHTISQRLRTLKKIPPELMPLGVVLAVAIGFAGYSLVSKLFSDKTLRLHRTQRSENFK